MVSSARRGWRSPAVFAAAFAFFIAAVGAPAVCRADVPLALVQSYGPTCDGDEHDLVWNGTSFRGDRGRARLRLEIPGQPVAAFLYVVGSDDPRKGGRRHPHGDDTVRAVILSPAGRWEDNVPVAYQALDVFVNRLDITPYVAPGLNRIRVRGYGLNDRQGVVAVAVYTAPGLPAVQVDLFDGADYGYYPLAPPFGPDSEVVASTWPPAGVDRAGRVWMALGGLQPRRGDEILMHTGAGPPDLGALPDSDGDGLRDLLQRQFRLTRRDRRPLGNDVADAAGNLEALAGAVSLEEDKLGVRCSRRGYCRGPELDLFAEDFTLPAGDGFAAFQVQSEDPEAGDSFTLVVAATRLPGECANPLPDYILTKSASIDEGFPGDLVTYTFVVTNTGLVPLENIVVTDSVLGHIGTVPLLGIGESATLTHVDYPLPACEGSALTVVERCDGVTVVEDRCSLPNTATAAWRDQVRTADDCVEIRKRPGIEIVKTVEPAEAYPGDTVTYAFTVTNTGHLTLHDVTVTDPTLSPAPIGVISALAPGASVTFTREIAAPACGDPRTLPGPCTDGSSECAAPVAAGAGGLGGELLGPAPACPEPEICHMPNTATAVGRTADGTVVTDDDSACLTILPLKVLGDTVWEDLDGDGSHDPGEPGMAGVEVTLTAPGGAVATALTDAAGSYLFGGLRHGPHEVAPTAPAGFSLTTGNAPLAAALGRCDGVFLGADFGYRVTAP